jgi:recombination protein RecR
LTIIEKLTKSLSQMPGLGSKSASRIVYHLLRADPAYVEELAAELLDLRRKVKTCRICGSYTEVQPCDICTDCGRDSGILCVVEESKDVLSIEAIHEYRGLYHVLTGVISPIDGIGPDKLRIASLLTRIKEESIREVILATNPTVEGDTTALYLVRLLQTEAEVKISRLALGLPVGGDLEYADRLTLTKAFQGRLTI